MHSIDDMNGHKFVVIGSLLLTIYCLRQLLRKQHEIEEALVVNDVERFLKFARLQGLIKHEDNVVVSALELSWLNEAYKSPNITRLSGSRP